MPDAAPGQRRVRLIRFAHLRAGWRVLRRHLRYAGGNPRKLLWIARRTLAIAREGALGGVLERHVAEDADYAGYADWCARYEPAPDARFDQRLDALGRRPLISILLPVWNPPLAFLAQTVASVRAQAYGNWELCIVDDASTDPAIAAFLAQAAGEEARIRVVRRAVNGGIAAATNDALGNARGDYCAFLDHDDVLARDAVLRVVEEVDAHPETALLFCDEDKLDVHGQRHAPFFKPNWDGEWLRTTNCVLHFTVVDTKLLRHRRGAGLGPRASCGGSRRSRAHSSFASCSLSLA
jgi:hypothetical protein